MLCQHRAGRYAPDLCIGRRKCTSSRKIVSRKVHREIHQTAGCSLIFVCEHGPLQGTRSRERPPLRWLDNVEKDLKLMGINGWKAIVTDSVNWRRISESALVCQLRL
ncbi:hypothetical protein TNCV_1592231 [Trichonephila clavipes]|nr:hypothetical protein TNCV_1592231 [Trichonephila clavipes]